MVAVAPTAERVWATAAPFCPPFSRRRYHLAGVMRLDLASGAVPESTTLPTPSHIGAASTALDAERGWFFFATNNNQLYRDVPLTLDERVDRLATLLGAYRVLRPHCGGGDILCDRPLDWPAEWPWPFPEAPPGSRR